MWQNWRSKLNFYSKKLTEKGNVATLARGAGSSFTLKIIGAGLLFAVQVTVARYLKPEGYGIYAFAFAWMSVLALLGQMGFDTASVRYIAAYKTQQEWRLLKGFLLYSNWVVAVASIVAGLGLALGTWICRDRLSLQSLHSLWLASLLLPVTTFLKIYEKRLIALKKIFLAQFPYLVLRNVLVLVCLLGFGLVLPRLSASSFMAIMLGASIISLLTSVFFWQREIKPVLTGIIPSFNSDEWLKTGRAMILVSSLQVVLAQSDTVMIGALVGTTETGLYSAARKIAGLLIFPLMAVNSILAPTVVGLHKQNSQFQLQRTVNLAVNSIFLITAAISIIIIIGGKPILGLFGTEFKTGYFILLINLFGQLVNAMAGPVALLLNMTGHQNDTAKILLVSAVVNVALNFWLIPPYKAMGAAIATVVATILWNVAMAIVVWRKMHLISIAMPQSLLPRK